MSTANRRLLIIVNLGTPDAPTPEAVHKFLLEFLSDPSVIDLPGWLWQPILRRLVLRRRPRRVAKLYRSIWTAGGSPLEVGTRKIAAGIEEIAGDRFDVAWAYRYGDRSLHRTFSERVGTDTEAVVLPLYAHRTSSTTGSVFLEADRVALALGVPANVRKVTLPADDPGFIDALADRCRVAWAEAGVEPEHLLLSYHGIPTRYDRRERKQYSADCLATTDALLRALDWDPGRATHCYQSKFGPEPWLKPTTAELFAELPRRGVRSLAVIAPGFLTDGLETIQEIGVRGRELFEEAGGDTFIRVDAPEDHPALLAALVRTAFPNS
ncbi:MAG: ferrochelatase [Acidobacteria bacterium]|nr:ferrochelatase [Acidobacteriota bacterium]